MSRVLDQVESSYLGFPLVIGERTVTVLTPDRRLVAETRALATARACVRAYRRTTPRDFELSPDIDQGRPHSQQERAGSPDKEAL